MKLSILTPSYQCEEFVVRSYLNLCNQTHTDWEWIFVDDGSTDNTLTIISALANSDERIRIFVNPKNMGRGFSRNLGVNNSSTDYIVVWDVDDLYHESRLNKIADAFNMGFDYFCSNALISDMSFKLKGARHASIGANHLDANFVHATLAFNKSISPCLNYPQSMRTGEDLKIMLYLQANFKGFYCSDYLFVYFEDREVSVGKAIQAVKSRLSILMDLRHDLSIADAIGDKKIKFEIFKVSLKLSALVVMSIYPPLYLYSVKYRNNSYIDAKSLDGGHLKLFCNCKEGN